MVNVLAITLEWPLRTNQSERDGSGIQCGYCYHGITTPAPHAGVGPVTIARLVAAIEDHAPHCTRTPGSPQASTIPPALKLAT